MESGPGPPFDGASERQMSLLPQMPSQLAQLPEIQQSPPMPQAPRMPHVSQDVEVIDLTGLSDEEDGNEWEDEPEVIDLTNLPSDDDEEQARIPRQYTILDLPARPHYTLLDIQPRTGQRRARRPSPCRAAPIAAAPVPAAPAARYPHAYAARVPVRREICELCARVVRWGPGVLITKHHLYPREVTKKYPERFTRAERNAVALLCRPCHDACHRAHSNRTLADYYYEVDLLRADPNIEVHVRSMQRATTPELIEKYGDGVTVVRRKKKQLLRAARKDPHVAQAVGSGDVSLPSRSQRRALRWALRNPPPPHVQRPLPHPGSVRRSARLAAKGIGQRLVPIIEIEDDDMQDAETRESPKGKEREGVHNVVSHELANLEARGEYIPL
ncbi:hypothetical protein diail_9434 [Diaporthe ilicicola]|nr:hypothetical protein diail_9434 [Diaporthe ilicicola]